MNTIEAVLRGQASRGEERMVFDWHKAALLIKEKNPNSVRAGLAEDWGFTGGDIYCDGEIIDQDSTYVYLASTWAMPMIELDGDMQDCYLMESETDSWDYNTYWPDSALKILKGE